MSVVVQISDVWFLAKHVVVVCVDVVAVYNDPRMVLLKYIVECTVMIAFTA